MNNKIFIFIGPPGSGKGSLSALCVQRFDWIQLSAGNICRREISQGTEIGKQIAFLIKSGKLIPDGLIADMIKKDLQVSLNSNSHIILDGFPRTVSQASEFETILQDISGTAPQLGIVRLLAQDETVIMRLTNRLICSNDTCQAVYSKFDTKLRPQETMICNVCMAPLRQRDDDTPDVVKDRLEQYKFHEKMMLDFYQQRNRPWVDVNAEKKIEDVFDEFNQLMSLK